RCRQPTYPPESLYYSQYSHNPNKIPLSQGKARYSIHSGHRTHTYADTNKIPHISVRLSCPYSLNDLPYSTAVRCNGTLRSILPSLRLHSIFQANGFASVCHQSCR